MIWKNSKCRILLALKNSRSKNKKYEDSTDPINLPARAFRRTCAPTLLLMRFPCEYLWGEDLTNKPYVRSLMNPRLWKRRMIYFQDNFQDTLVRVPRDTIRAATRWGYLHSDDILKQNPKIKKIICEKIFFDLFVQTVRYETLRSLFISTASKDRFFLLYNKLSLCS